MSKKFKNKAFARILSLHSLCTGHKVARELPQNPSFSRIIVYSTTALGDFMFATPAIRALRQRFPEAQIALVVDPKFQTFINKSYPHIDQVFYWNGQWKGCCTFIKKLRAFKPQLAVLLHSHPPYDLVSASLAGSNTVLKNCHYPELSPFEPWITHWQDKDIGSPFIVQRLDLIAPLGCQTDDIHMEIPCPFPHLPKKTDRFMIGFQMSTSDASLERRWSIDYFARLAEKLLSFPRPVEIALIGSSEEAIKGKQFLALLPEKQQDKVVNYIGKTSIIELLSILKQMDLLVTLDTGPLHLAVALKTPVVVLIPSPETTKSSQPIQDTEIHTILKPTDVDANGQLYHPVSIMPERVFDVIQSKYMKASELPHH